MDDIIVEPDWRTRLMALRSSRRAIWPLMGVVAGVACAVLVLGARGAPARIAPPSTAATPASEAEAARLLVHVAGEVRRPGLYELAQGSRIADAIAAAGGPTRTADLDALNLAQLTVDGTQVLVPARGAATTAAAPVAPDQGVAVSLNTAGTPELESIPGIGPVLASAIVAFREQAGGFASIEQLLEVDGIGPGTLEEIRPHVTL